MADPLRHAKYDGIAQLNFSTASRPVALPCGQHTLHVLDVRLHRASEGARGEATTCVADSGEADALLGEARGMLGPGAHASSAAAGSASDCSDDEDDSDADESDSSGEDR